MRPTPNNQATMQQMNFNLQTPKKLAHSTKLSMFLYVW
jgi:hypothetical protein